MDQEKIGKVIKEIREKNNLTQKEFADKYNVTFQAVSKWENGKNIPDIVILKQICDDNKIKLDDLLSDNNKIIKKKNYLIYIIPVFVILVIIGAVIVFTKEDDFELKKITSSCSAFKLTGSAAYNKDKSSIYISNIEFCGEDDDSIYKKLEYKFYEVENNKNTLISNGYVKNNMTLEEYLKGLEISVENYSHVCKSFDNSELYIELDVTNDKDVITSYKIPISLDNTCK